MTNLSIIGVVIEKILVIYFKRQQNNEWDASKKCFFVTDNRKVSNGN